MKNLLQWTGNIIKWMFQSLTFLRTLLLNLFLLFVIFAIFNFFFTYNNFNETIQEYKPPIKGALKLNISGYLFDDVVSHYAPDNIETSSNEKNKNFIEGNSVYEIVAKIRQAAVDPKITGMILDLQEFSGCNFSALDYIAKALKEFKTHNKKIYSIETNVSQNQYYLDSIADKIFLTPEGQIFLKGLHLQETFFKKLLDRVKIQSIVFRIGKYKSAVEPYLRNNMSPDSKKNKSQWLHDMWFYYLNNVAKNRHTSVDVIFPKYDVYLRDYRELQGDMAKFSKKHHLVDEILNEQQINKKFEKIFGFDKENQTYCNTSIYDYQIEDFESKKNKIAVISINGLLYGDGYTYDAIDTSSIATKIHDAGNNPDVKAIVIRLNSPGGEVDSSEIIRQEMIQAKKNGKPIVISMGDIAASGGYWIASAGDFIFANNHTITGSIGIFSILHNLQKSLNAIGIFQENLSTSEMLNFSPYSPLSPFLKNFMQLNLDLNYEQFIKIVAESRHKTEKYIDNISQGKIWNGKQAQSIGLIDKIGDFDDAINKAAEIAKIKDFEIIVSNQDAADAWQNLTTTLHKNVVYIIKKLLPPDVIMIFSKISNIIVNHYEDIHILSNIIFKDQDFTTYAMCTNCSKIQMN
ncbi:signal peptide peptidase SppA [Buchnera aphidicola (Thelaxes californica)]|uniref:Signal peptide peptidase SppA n=1 Tax=Buchnera aphidicola (Thelaxes californica) TaxID=1315998 RepID=A0A4D6YNV6_9GAMM|nr:signal peptide peptidase SppA [Buchnera aphidicola]QCI26745.1 signal peptide peptidase SppA [Buchnera aphidicola (Thelaxes californica)]